MRFETAALLASLSLAGPAHAINIIASNDDGWAEVNIRALYESLTSAGHLTVVSAPAQDESGTGRLFSSSLPFPRLITAYDRL